MLHGPVLVGKPSHGLEEIKDISKETKVTFRHITQEANATTYSPVKARANKESTLIESSNILMFLLTIILS